MTLIGFATHRDRAEIISDSIAYNQCGSKVDLTAEVRKVTHLPNLATVVAAQGSGVFAHRWGDAMRHLAPKVTDFDAFTRKVEALFLPMVPAKMALATGADREWTALHIGYSDAAGRFVACGYTEAGGRVRRYDLDGLYVMPTPLQYRPGPVEALRTPAQLASGHGPDGRPAMSQAEAAATVRDVWQARPQYRTPTTVEQWRRLAVRAHRSRSLECPARSNMKVLIGGDVTLTRLTRHEATTEKIHAFDDPDEFRQMMAGTLHPFGQTGPCWCDSGRRWVDCHMATLPSDTVCVCGTGRRFADCCSIYAPATEAVADSAPVRNDALVPA